MAPPTPTSSGDHPPPPPGAGAPLVLVDDDPREREPPAGDPRERLRATLETYRDQGLLVAMSAGVDSCTLAHVARDVLGDATVAVTLVAESTSREEVDEARRFAEAHGLAHRVVEHSELADPAYVRNDPQRCYHCRKNMAVELERVAAELGLGAIAMGVVLDDFGEHRPGLRAAREADVRFPYVDAHLSKADVRELAAAEGLDVADKPANACLSSRIAFGLKVTQERLRRIEAAERAVRGLAQVDQVRVRYHEGDVARIEVSPGDRARLLAVADEVAAELERIGFTFVAMDLLGYRSGAMNEALPS